MTDANDVTKLFQTGSSDEIVGAVFYNKPENNVFFDNGQEFLAILVPVLCDLRDKEIISLDKETIIRFMKLDKLLELVAPNGNYHTHISAKSKARVYRYLSSLGIHYLLCDSSDLKEPTLRQHALVSGSILSNLAGLFRDTVPKMEQLNA